jgi:flavin reductase (DIM6/NTAB) family NADH-FMN oxidoreductase RutF
MAQTTPLFSQQDFRAALSQFATGVTVVTTKKEDGSFLGVTINSFTSVSLDPPLILFCLGRRRDSYHHLQKAPHFIVNILSEPQQSLAERFASIDKDDWQQIGYDCNAHGLPMLKGTLATLECRRHEVIQAGDHDIFLGHVEHIRVAEGAPGLLYFGSSYRALSPRKTS